MAEEDAELVALIDNELDEGAKGRVRFCPMPIFQCQFWNPPKRAS
jgi:hypothetical protein